MFGSLVIRNIKNIEKILTRNPGLNDVALKRFYSVESNKFVRAVTEDAKTIETTNFDPDSFGDLGTDKYIRHKMTEDEIKEEEFVNNEAQVPKHLKLRPGQYIRIMKNHLEKGDLKSAVEVLDMMKAVRDKPSEYMYRLLITSLADKEGNLEKAFQLFFQLKKSNQKINNKMFTSLVNACANSKNKIKAIEQLEYLREYFIKHQIPLNEIHYNAMIKAYGHHGYIFEAFQLVDEMRDKKMSTGVDTFNNLLNATISCKDSGVRYALVVWQYMRKFRITPSVITYNLLLRTVRDTGLGDFEPGANLIPGNDSTQILLEEGPMQSLLKLIPKNHNPQLLLGDSAGTKRKLMSKENFHEAFKNNKLGILGGFHGIIDEMNSDNVKPDVKTMTLLLEISPKSTSAEEQVIQYAKSRNIQLDIDFYNMLIRKRTSRGKLKLARETLSYIEREGLAPNIITWGVLAHACSGTDHCYEIIQGMKISGHVMNSIIAAALFKKGIEFKNFKFIYQLMSYMKKRRIKPDDRIFKMLDDFKKDMERRLTHGKDKKNLLLRRDFEAFKLKYQLWQDYQNRPEDTDVI